jgi:hypothetical protein
MIISSNFTFITDVRKTLGINGAVIVKKFNNKNLRSVITLLRILLVTCEEGVVDPAKVTLAYKTQPLLLVCNNRCIIVDDSKTLS